MLVVIAVMKARDGMEQELEQALKEIKQGKAEDIDWDKI